MFSRLKVFLGNLFRGATPDNPVPPVVVPVLDHFPGLKTYATGLAMIGFGAFQILSGSVPTGVVSILGGLAGIFGRRAVDRPKS